MFKSEILVHLGFQDLSCFSDCKKSDERTEEENILEVSSTTISVHLGSNDDNDNARAEYRETGNDNNFQTISYMSGKASKRRETHVTASIKMNADTVKFIDKRNVFKEELKKQLKELHGQVLLMPKENRIQVTKEPGQIHIKDWGKKCRTKVKIFCDRFSKNQFKLEETNSVRKSLPKLGRLLQSTTAAYWIESNKTLAVMSEQSERDEVLDKVNQFLQSTDGKQL